MLLPAVATLLVMGTVAFAAWGPTASPSPSRIPSIVTDRPLVARAVLTAPAAAQPAPEKAGSGAQVAATPPSGKPAATSGSSAGAPALPRPGTTPSKTPPSASPGPSGKSEADEPSVGADEKDREVVTPPVREDEGEDADDEVDSSNDAPTSDGEHTE